MRHWIPLLALTVACTGDEAPVDSDTDVPSVYADDAMWACAPGTPDDVCGRELALTVLAPDGTSDLVDVPTGADPTMDCFYVYPTVDLTSGGLDTDFSEPGAKLDPLLGQAAPFRESCRVFAPYYRQVALNAFGVPGLFDTAYGDVRDAWRQFVAHRSDGRPFALIGHSQGTAHLVRLLQEEIEPDAALHARLRLAILLGGTIEVPTGADVGGTFASTPLCTTAGQTGCVIAWDTYATDRPPEPDDLFGYASAGHENACTDPQVLSGNDSGKLAESWFPTTTYGAAFSNTYKPYDGTETTFVAIRDALTAACVSRDGARWLDVDHAPATDDTRPTPPYRNVIQETIGFGMHGMDFHVPLGDLRTIVASAAP